MLTCDDLEPTLRSYGVRFLSVHVPACPGAPWRADVRLAERDWSIGHPQPTLAAAILDALRQTGPFDPRHVDPLEDL